MMYIVDDAADYRFLVQQVFKRFLPQYSLRLFADGQDLIQHVEEPSNSGSTDSVRDGEAWPSLIVLDVDMPKLNGFQTLKQLKQHPHWQSVPVVMMSNRSEPRFIEAAHKLGASTYITKPMDMAALKEVMGQLYHRWLDA